MFWFFLSPKRPIYICENNKDSRIWGLVLNGLLMYLTLHPKIKFWRGGLWPLVTEHGSVGKMAFCSPLGVHFDGRRGPSACNYIIWVYWLQTSICLTPNDGDPNFRGPITQPQLLCGIFSSSWRPAEYHWAGLSGWTFCLHENCGRN